MKSTAAHTPHLTQRPFRGYLLPRGITPASVRTVMFGDLPIDVIDEGPEFYRRLIARLRAAHTTTQRRIPVRETIAILAEAARQWMNPDDPLRRLAVDRLPQLTGFAPAMIEEGLNHLFSGYTRRNLATLVIDAAGRLDALDRPIHTDGSDDGASQRAVGPAVSALIVAGNVPGLVVPELTAVLLAKSACLIKPASREPLTPLLFAQTLVELDHRLADSLAVVWWPKEVSAITAAVGSTVDCVVASGDEATINTLAPLAPRFIGYGDRLSLAMIGADALANQADLASRLARDICWYEQHGCLSPHLIYVEEGGAVTARQFAEELARALERHAARWPQRPIPMESAGAILQLRGEMEFRAAAGAACALHGSALGGTVLYDTDPTPRRSPGYRTIWVKPVRSLVDAADHLHVWRGTIESIGLAVSPDRAQALSERLTALGVSRLCSIGTMQEPPMTWRRGNRLLLRELLTWTETRTE